MAVIREDFVGVVHVYSGGESVFLHAGEEVPKGVRVREDVLAGPGEVVSDEVDQDADIDVGDGEDQRADTGVDVEGMPADSDSREAWNTYAESVDFDPSPYSKKEALIEALKRR